MLTGPETSKFASALTAPKPTPPTHRNTSAFQTFCDTNVFITRPACELKRGQREKPPPPRCRRGGGRSVETQCAMRWPGLVAHCEATTVAPEVVRAAVPIRYELCSRPRPCRPTQRRKVRDRLKQVKNSLRQGCCSRW